MDGSLQAAKIPRERAVAVPPRPSELSPDGEAFIHSWPPVALVASPVLAKALGVGTGTLRNWRFRNQGPPAEPSILYGKGPPHPVYYRVSRLLEWLGASQEPAWKFERAWLASRFKGWRFVLNEEAVDVSDQMNEVETLGVAEAVRHEAHRLDFNAAAGIAAWPCRQPTRRRSYARPTASN